MTVASPDTFAGFPKAGLTFLRDLARNNDRTWFGERKHVYTNHVDLPMRALMFALAERCANARIPLAPNPKSPTFRIYRDVRFSADKSPYKTHVGAVLYRGGDKTASGCVYVHVEPKGAFVAAAFYHPEPATLARLRQAMIGSPAFARCVATLEKRGLTLETDDALQRLPRAFAEHAGSRLEPYLKLTSLIVRRELAPSALGKPGLTDEVFAFTREAMPLLTWGWGALPAP